MTDLLPAAPDADDTPTRSGSVFVIGTVVFLVALVVMLLVVSPRLQDRMGLADETPPLPPPAETTQVDLTLDGQPIGTAVWDEDGVCAELTDADGVTFRTCAVPDPLRPIWAIDAPDEADPPYVILAHPPYVSSVAGLTVEQVPLEGMTQARELAAAWTIIALPEGGSVSELIAYNADGSDLGNVLCGTEDSPGGGSDRLAGGCVVPRQD